MGWSLPVIKHLSVTSKYNLPYSVLWCWGWDCLVFISSLPLSGYSNRRHWGKTREKVEREREKNILLFVDLLCLLMYPSPCENSWFQSPGFCIPRTSVIVPSQGISFSQATSLPCESDPKCASILLHMAEILAAHRQTTEVWDPARGAPLLITCDSTSSHVVPCSWRSDSQLWGYLLWAAELLSPSRWYPLFRWLSPVL